MSSSSSPRTLFLRRYHSYSDKFKFYIVIIFANILLKTTFFTEFVTFEAIYFLLQLHIMCIVQSRKTVQNKYGINLYHEILNFTCFYFCNWYGCYYYNIGSFSGLQQYCRIWISWGLTQGRLFSYSQSYLPFVDCLILGMKLLQPLEKCVIINQSKLCDVLEILNYTSGYIWAQIYPTL